MRSNHARFLLRMALVFGFLVVGNLVFNVVIDTYGIFGMPRLKSVNAEKLGFDRHARIAKGYAIPGNKPEAIILGSSRAESAFDPLHPYFSGLRTYNVAFPAAAAYEEFRYLQHASHGGHLKRAVVAIDYHQFVDQRQKISSDFSEERLALDASGEIQAFPWFDLISLAASGSAFKESWWAFRYQQRRKSIYRADGYRDDGDDIPSMMRNRGGQKYEFLASERGYVRVYRKGASAVSDYKWINRPPIDDIVAMRKLADEKNIDLIFVISPVHARHLALIKALGLWSSFEEWKRQLVAVAGGKLVGGACTLWDFASINAITAEPVPEDGTNTSMKWWRESSHVTSAGGAKMLDVIQSGTPYEGQYGDCLTPERIDAVLLRQRIALDDWESKNPRDVAEIRGLVDNVR